MKPTLRVLVLLICVTIPSNQLLAGCAGLCLSLDSTSTPGSSTLEDTTYIQNGSSAKIYAIYNNACKMILEGANPQMQLVWYKDGITYDTTSLVNATYDNIWTYYTQFYATEPGLYEVYFMGFYQPNSPCRKIRVIENSEQIGGAISGIEENGETHVKLYPNPSFNGIIYVETTESIMQVEILDISGMKIQDVMGGNNYNLVINTTTMRKGMYLVRIYQSTGVVTRKVMVS
jgi:hypothetical protein